MPVPAPAMTDSIRGGSGGAAAAVKPPIEPARQRDIIPVPSVLRRPRAVPTGREVRSVVRRRRMATSSLDWADDAICSLNDLYGISTVLNAPAWPGASPAPGPPGAFVDDSPQSGPLCVSRFSSFASPSNASQAMALAHITDRCAQVGPPPGDLRSGKESLGERLAGSSVYSSDKGPRRPFVRDNISLTELEAKPIPLADALSPTDRAWLGGWRDSLLRSAQEAATLQREACPIVFF